MVNSHDYSIVLCYIRYGACRTKVLNSVSMNSVLVAFNVSLLLLSHSATLSDSMIILNSISCGFPIFNDTLVSSAYIETLTSSTAEGKSFIYE